VRSNAKVRERRDESRSMLLREVVFFRAEKENQRKSRGKQRKAASGEVGRL